MPMIAAKRVNIGDLIQITRADQTQQGKLVVVEGVVEAASDIAGTDIICLSIYRQPGVMCKGGDEVKLIKPGHCVVEELEDKHAIVCNHTRWYPLYRMSQRWRWDICKASPISSETRWYHTREEAISFVERYKR